MAKGGGSANKTFLYQETKALLNPKRLATFLDEKLRSLGTAACPPYHLAIVVGGMSAEYTLKVAKLASARYLDTLPTPGSELGHAFRDRDLEQQVLELTRELRHRRAVRRQVLLPRRAGDPAAPARRVAARSASRCPARPTARPRPRSPPTGVFLEQLERDPARFLPDVTDGRRPVRRGRAGRPEPADGRDPRPALHAAGEDPGVADRPAGRGPRHRPRQDRRAAGRRRADAGTTCATTPSTTPARPRRPRATRPARSGRPRPAGWTPTSSSSRPPAARW